MRTRLLVKSIKPSISLLTFIKKSKVTEMIKSTNDDQGDKVIKKTNSRRWRSPSSSESMEELNK